MSYMPCFADAEKVGKGYIVLGITPGSTSEEIKKAHKQLVLKYHPDKNNGDTTATEKFRQVQEAYETLTDPKNYMYK